MGWADDGMANGVQRIVMSRVIILNVGMGAAL